MRILNISDFHLSGDLYDSKMNALEQALSGRDFDMLVFAGDIFHQSRVGGGGRSASQIIAGLEKALTFDKPVVMIEGNHDLMGTKSSALDYLHMPNLVKVKDSPMWMGFEDTEILFIPWIRNRLDYKEFVLGEMNRIEPTRKHRLLVGHMCIVDATMNQAHKVNADDYFSFGLRELQRTVFMPTSLLAGHLHSRQLLGSGFGAYVGGFTQNSFGEGQNPMGYAYWERDQIEFAEVEAPRWISCTEDEYLAVPEEQRTEFYRFATEQPERYRDIANVKPLTFEEFTPRTGPEKAYSNDISLKDLIQEYCYEAQIEIPKGEFVLEELNKLELRICRAQTGFSRLNSIHLKNFGPKGNIVHKNTEISFEDGLVAVIGRNGSGKSLAVESCIAGLYGSYVQRGAIKNFLEAPGAQMSLSLSAPGTDCHISHRKAPKGLLSTFNDVECTLRGEVSSQVSPIFGEASVFQAVVFMDQGSKKDLVEAEEAKRIEIFRSLLNLDFLSTFKEVYSKELKTLKDEQKNHAAFTEQLESIKARVLRLKASRDETPAVDAEEIKSLREVYARLTRLSEARVKLQDYRNQESLLQKTVAEYEAYDVNTLILRRQSYYSKKSELEQMQRQVKQGDIGCAPNYLPCSFLKNFNVERMEKLEIEVADLALNAEETSAVNAYSMASRIQNTMQSLWREEFHDLLDVENEDLGSVQSRLTMLTQQQKHRATVDREFSEAKAEYSRVKAKLDALDEKQDRIRELSFLTGLCDKKGLPLYIISSITKELQKILDSLCETCDNGLRLRISMSKDEQLDCFQILFSYKGSPWAKVVPCASGGQLTILKIVFKLGLMLYLNKFFGNYQVLIMDEPESGLDVENVAVLLRLLDSLRGQFTQIIIVTHNDYITQIADQIVRVG